MSTQTHDQNPLAQAIAILGGLTELANLVGLRYQAVYKWQKSNRLPQSDHTGATNYAGKISEATQGKVSKEALLEWSAAEWATQASKAA